MSDLTFKKQQGDNCWMALLDYADLTVNYDKYTKKYAYQVFTTLSGKSRSRCAFSKPYNTFEEAKIACLRAMQRILENEVRKIVTEILK